MQISPSVSWITSERRGPGARRPKLAITSVCVITKIPAAPIRCLEESQRNDFFNCGLLTNVASSRRLDDRDSILQQWNSLGTYDVV